MEKKFITAGVVVYKGIKYLRMSNDTPEQRMRVLAKVAHQAQFFKMWSLPYAMTHEEAVDWLNANITELKVLSGEMVTRGQIPWDKEDFNTERCPAARAPKERKSRVYKANEHKEVDNSPARYYHDCAPGKSLSFIEERAGAMGEAYIRLNGLKSFTNEFVKSIFTKFASAGYVPTPFALVEEVVSKCPVTEDSIVGVIESMEWAVYMRVCKDVRDVTFIVDGEASDREKKTADAFGIKYIQLSEVERTGMKFDVVVGNPPYQEKKEGNDKTDNLLWQKILLKVAKAVKQDGALAMIHPSGWRGINESYFLKTKELLYSMDLQYLNINGIEDGKKVFGASTRFDWYVAYNRPYQGQTVVNDENGFETTSNLSELPVIPNDFTVDLNKWISGADKCEFGYSASWYHCQRDHMSPVKTDEFKFPCVRNVGVSNQPSKFWYSNVNKGMFGVPKVIFGRFGYGIFIDRLGEYGCTEDCAFIAAPVEELEKIREVLQSEEFLKFANATYFGGTGSVFDKKVMALLKKDFWK